MRDKCLEGSLLKKKMLTYLIDQELSSVKVEEPEWEQAVSVCGRGKMLACVESDGHPSPLELVVQFGSGYSPNVRLCKRLRYN